MTGAVNVSLPAHWELVVYRGDTWSQVFRLLHDDEPLDLIGGGYSPAAWCRSPGGEITAMAVQFLDDNPGALAISFPDNVMPEARDYRYDVELTESNGVVTTWVTGRLRMMRDVTHEQGVGVGVG